MFCEQRRGGHDLSRLAVAALRHVDFFPGLLQRMRAVRRESFDSGDVCVGDGGYGRDAGALGLSADMHRTRAALADAATVLSAVEIEYVPQHPKKGSIGRRIDAGRAPINSQLDRHNPPLTISPTNPAGQRPFPFDWYLPHGKINESSVTITAMSVAVPPDLSGNAEVRLLAALMRAKDLDEVNEAAINALLNATHAIRAAILVFETTE